MVPSATHPEQLVEEFREVGFALVRGLFPSEESASLRDHFMALRAEGPKPLDLAGADLGDDDPLVRFPRMVHMQRWDEVSLRWLLDDRLRTTLTTLLGAEPLAVQSMLYFKPPGARGQSLHQDQRYLRASPGTCVGAWMALDPVDEANGCLRLVPGTAGLPLICEEPADTTQSFTASGLPSSLGAGAVSARMDPGDVLFFVGSVIHGSLPNTTTDRFRRALIGHYVTAETREVGWYYHPVLRFDGTEAPLAAAPLGGPCGEVVMKDGALEVIASQ